MSERKFPDEDFIADDALFGRLTMIHHGGNQHVVFIEDGDASDILPDLFTACLGVKRGGGSVPVRVRTLGGKIMFEKPQ